jgi:MazG family protein
LQVLFHSVMAEERGAFGLHDVADALITKMKRRHPHLYADGVKEPWEKMKAKKRPSIGAGLPAGLPALHRAQRIQERAAGLGFDWPDVAGPVEKIREELDEVRIHLESAPAIIGPSGATVLDERHAALEEELGDLLFSCVNLCRKAGVHAALALDRSNRKFEERFGELEKLARDRGVALGEATLQELDE